MEFLKFYKTSLSDKLSSLSKPLKTSFGLDGFFYTYMAVDGQFFQIGNQAEVGETYFSNELFKKNPLFCHPENYRSIKNFITDDLKSNSFHEAQAIIQNYHGFKNFYIIPKLESNGIHLFKFSSSDQRIPLNSIFLQNSYALDQFAAYFFDAWKQYFSKMDSFTVNMGELIGSHFFKKNVDIIHTPDKARIKQFGLELGIIDGSAKIESLSKREKDCIEVLLTGKTASQIGEILGISDRTVFHYLDNVKDKMGCFSKTELFELLQIYQKLKLI